MHNIFFLLIAKCFYKVSFMYIDLILFGIYILLGIIGLLIISSDSFKVFIIVLGVWYIGSFFLNKRL